VLTEIYLAAIKIRSKAMETQIAEIIVKNARLNRAEAEAGIDTGVDDGGGCLTVSAEAAEQRGKDVVFLGVSIHATRGSMGKGYAGWSQDSLIAEAVEMLKQDYCI
jgi:hypothetical protein